MKDDTNPKVDDTPIEDGKQKKQATAMVYTVNKMVEYVAVTIHCGSMVIEERVFYRKDYSAPEQMVKDTFEYAAGHGVPDVHHEFPINVEYDWTKAPYLPDALADLWREIRDGGRVPIVIEVSVHDLRTVCIHCCRDMKAKSERRDKE
jgi:hypothetical protein